MPWWTREMTRTRQTQHGIGEVQKIPSTIIPVTKREGNAEVIENRRSVPIAFLIEQQWLRR
jgi:hypothetical protein